MVVERTFFVSLLKRSLAAELSQSYISSRNTLRPEVAVQWVQAYSAGSNRYKIDSIFDAFVSETGISQVSIFLPRFLLFCSTLAHLFFRFCFSNIVFGLKLVYTRYIVGHTLSTYSKHI